MMMMLEDKKKEARFTHFTTTIHTTRNTQVLRRVVALHTHLNEFAIMVSADYLNPRHLTCNAKKGHPHFIFKETTNTTSQLS